MKRLIIAFIAAYIFLFVWGWLLNGVLLKDIYAQTPNLWRTQTEMLSFFHWILIGQALIVFAFVMLYVAGFAGGGVVAGIRLGILLEIAAIGMRMGVYAVQPLPRKLLIYASIGGLIEMIIFGAIVGALEAEARSVLRGLPLERITFYRVPTNEPWCRDHGPTFLTRDRDPKLAVADWDYNAWGNKYPPFDLDEVVPTCLAEILKLPL